MDDAARRDARLIARFRILLAIMVALLAVAELLAACGMTVEPLSAIWGAHGFGQFFAMAMLGTFALHLFCGPPRREAAVALVAGLVGEAVRILLCWRAGWDAAAIVSHVGVGAGVASLAVQAWFAARARGEERARRLVVLLACLLIDGFVLLSNSFVSLTTPLHPRTLDGLVYAFDDSLGFQPGFAVGRLFRAAPALEQVASVIYLATPFGFALLWAAARRARARPPVDVITAFLVASAAGFALYHAFPVVGPKYVVGDGWPLKAPPVAQLGLMPALAPPLPRNCVPSLHTTWVLLLLWHARGRGPLIGAVAVVFVVFTLLATLGLGYHYAVDLVVAVPFVAAAQVACAPPSPSRRRALPVCAALLVGWLSLLRAGLLVRHPLPALSWALVVATVAAALWLERDVWRASAAAVVSEPALPASAADAALGRGIVAAVFVSGCAGVSYEMLLARELAFIFGATACSATTLLATWLGAFALGAWAGGRVGSRRGDALRLSAACVGAIALFGAASPSLVRGVRGAWVLLAGGGDPARPSLTGLQLLLGAAVLGPPTFLAGVTLPLVARHFCDRRQSLGFTIGTLGGAFTLGGALGAVVTAYVLLPSFGVAATTWLAVAAGLTVALVVLRLYPRASALPPPPEASVLPPAQRRHRWLAVAIIAVGGVVSLPLALVYLHLGAVVAGDSAYAVALMLGCLLLALGLGALVMRRALGDGLDPAGGLAWCQLGVAVCLLAGVFGWNAIPDYFASFDTYAAARTFGSREVIRLVVYAMALMPPAACLGAAYTAALEWVGRGTTRPVAALGSAAALHALGSFVGALVSAPLVARLGTLHTLHLLAGVATLLGLLAVAGVARGRRRFALAPFGAVAALALAQPRAFDLNRLASGAHIYFAPPRHREPGVPALPALLHTTVRGPALALGADAAATARALGAAGFAPVDAVARTPVDERVWLLVRGARYQLISVAPVAIWTAGAGALYDREIYELAAASLAPHGVVQQRLPLHRLAPLDLASALASLHAVFPHVWLYVVGDQGLMVGCADACPPAPDAVERPLLDAAGIDRLVAAAAKAVGEAPDDIVSTEDNLFLELHTPRATARPYGPSLQLNLKWLRSFAAP